jgi:hypothetical protein
LWCSPLKAGLFDGGPCSQKFPFVYLRATLILWCSHLKAGRFDGGPCSQKSPFGLFEGNAKTAEKSKLLHHYVLHSLQLNCNSFKFNPHHIHILYNFFADSFQLHYNSTLFLCSNLQPILPCGGVAYLSLCTCLSLFVKFR